MSDLYEQQRERDDLRRIHELQRARIALQAIANFVVHRATICVLDATIISQYVEGGL